MTRRKIIGLLVVALVVALLVVGHISRQRIRRAWLKPVTIDRRGALTDIELPVFSRSCDSQGGCVIETFGLDQGKAVGLTVITAPGMRESFFTAKVSTSRVFPTPAGVSFVVEGPRGRSLLRLVAESYGRNTYHSALPKTIVMTAVPIQGNPAEIQTRPLRLKLVHPGDDYFELFLDTDLANKKVTLVEKDVAYRAAILKTFGVQ